MNIIVLQVTAIIVGIAVVCFLGRLFWGSNKHSNLDYSNIIPSGLANPEQNLTASADHWIITEEFASIARTLREGVPVFLVTGGAGTGKTTLIEWLIQTKVADLVIAFTGAAALNCKGVTINSFLQLPPETIFPSDSLEPVKEETKSLVNNIHTIVVDEISMVRADLMDAIDRRLREIRQTSQPFGGIQMVFVGDPYQLPPVVDNRDKVFFSPNRPQCQWQSGWFFDANVFSRVSIKHFALTHVFRQKESEKEYITNLGYIRRSRNITAAVQYFNQHCCSVPPASNAITITTDNATANKRNQYELSKLPGDALTSYATASGAYASITRFSLSNNKNSFKDNLNDLRKLPAPYELKVKVGAMVMILINDPLRQYVNGSTGIVKKIDPEQECIMVELTNGSHVGIRKHSWSSKRIDWDTDLQRPIRSNDGEFVQYPLTLAWAITCHKAQGRTLESVYIDFAKKPFAPGQTYVALSRTTQIADLKLSSPLSVNNFPRDDRLEEWIESLKQSKLSFSAPKDA